MHPDGASDASDLDKEIDELRLRCKQLTELIDHHKEHWQGIIHLALGAQRIVLRDVCEISRLLEDTLTSLNLAENGIVEAINKTGCVFEVVDDCRGVRQRFEPGEGGTTFEVHENKRELVRRVANHLREDKGCLLYTSDAADE